MKFFNTLFISNENFKLHPISLIIVTLVPFRSNDFEYVDHYGMGMNLTKLLQGTSIPNHPYACTESQHILSKWAHMVSFPSLSS